MGAIKNAALQVRSLWVITSGEQDRAAQTNQVPNFLGHFTRRIVVGTPEDGDHGDLFPGHLSLLLQASAVCGHGVHGDPPHSSATALIRKAALRGMLLLGFHVRYGHLAQSGLRHVQSFSNNLYAWNKTHAANGPSGPGNCVLEAPKQDGAPLRLRPESLNCALHSSGEPTALGYGQFLTEPALRETLVMFPARDLCLRLTECQPEPRRRIPDRIHKFFRAPGLNISFLEGYEHQGMRLTKQLVRDTAAVIIVVREGRSARLCGAATPAGASLTGGDVL
jgi:hypothetical protein